MTVRPSGVSQENDAESVESIDPDEAEELVPRLNVEPIRTVVRELTRPDGSTVTVEVPVYPPFEMKDLQNRLDRKNGKPSANNKRARAK